METSGLGPRSLAAWVKAGTGPSSCVSLRLLVEEFRRVFLRSSPLSLLLAVIVPGVWVLLRSTETWIFREMFISVGAMLCTTVDTCSSGALEEFTHFQRCGGLDS